MHLRRRQRYTSFFLQIIQNHAISSAHALNGESKSEVGPKKKLARSGAIARDGVEIEVEDSEDRRTSPDVWKTVNCSTKG